MFDKFKILPFIIFVSTVIVLLWLVKVYNNEHLHRLKSRLFIIHTVFPIIVVGMGGMFVLWFGGIDCAADLYDKLHFNIVEPLRKTLPVTIRLLTTIIALLLTFIIVRPKLQIYPIAAYEISNNQYWLTFSVKNISWWDGFDMKAELFSYQIDSTDGRDNKAIKVIPLDITSKSSVLGWRLAHSNENTILVETKNQVFKKNQFKNSDNRLELRVTITHPLSRITKVFVREFTKFDIHHGEFIDHDIRRYSRENHQQVITKTLPKVTCWKIAERLKSIEFWIIILLIFEIGWYVTFTPSNENIICIASYLFYSAVLATGIMEIVRQILQRPMKCKFCESSI